MRRHERQYVAGRCINCLGRGEMDLETFLGILNEEDAHRCSLCWGTGILTEERIRELGWAE